MRLSIFLRAYLLSVGFPRRSIHFNLWPILFWGCIYFWYWVTSYLYVLEMNPLWAISFANLSSYSECCACLSFRVSFGTQMVLWLMRSHLLICGLFFIILRGGYMKNLLHFMSRQWHPTPVLLPGKSYGRRSLEGCSLWVAEGQTRLSAFTFTFTLSFLV